MNLAKTYANSFVNAGLCNDTLISKRTEGDDDWVFANKDEGQIAAAASVGLLQIWDVDNGFEFIDKYVESDNTDIQSGAFIALGMLQSGIRYEADAAFALLSDKLESVQK